MEYLKKLIDFVLHIDKYLQLILQDYGVWIYGILFAIIFVETGLVVMPFLPGDSLLFATGALIKVTNELNIWLMGSLLFVAAVLGDTANYFIGKKLGKAVFEKESKWIKKEYLLKTQQFYEKHGGKAIIFARFVPIVRTFAPFVAGIGTMNYAKFILYNLTGGFVWVWAFLLLGYFFAEAEIVKKNFTLVIFAIIFISILPPIIEVLRHKFAAKKD
ncbi:MAG: DedA family protein [Thermonemataceae bacterium]|nr:DedA family protein [Thermonemataceae bacterium]